MTTYEYRYQDPDDEANKGLFWRTGKPCIEQGCDEPAGTGWSPLWCFKHNVERIDRISRRLEALDEQMSAAK